MTFIGYCTTAELAKFLDIGAWQQDVSLTESYSTNDLVINTASSNGINFHLIDGLVYIYEDGVEIPSEDYTIDLDTGAITFSEEPTEESVITATYYLVEDFSDTDLEYYVLLGAYELETDTRQKFREQTLIDYTTDVNKGLDYTIQNYNQSYLNLPYGPVLSVSSLTIDGTSITPSTLKIDGNKIFLTDTSEKSYFTGDADSVVISFKYGITDTVEDRTDEDLIKLSLAKEANKFASAMVISKSPLGQNVFFDNSKFTQMSKGDVRPETLNENLLIKIKEGYDRYINRLRAMSFYSL